MTNGRMALLVALALTIPAASASSYRTVTFEGITYLGVDGVIDGKKVEGSRVVSITIPPGGSIRHLDIANDDGHMKIRGGEFSNFTESLTDAVQVSP